MTIIQLCPICKSENLEKYFNTNTDLIKCLNCYVIFDSKTQLELNQYKNIQNNQYRLDVDKLKSRIRNVKQRINILKPYFKGDTILDIGCGEGSFLMMTKSFIKNIKGIEPNNFYANFARNLGIEIIEKSIEEVNFSPNYFDIITMFHVLEHLKDPLVVLKKINTWLKDEGLIVIEVPNIESPYAKYKKENWEMINSEHKFYFCPSSLKYLFDKTSFELILLKSRDFDQYRVSIGKNLRKLGINFKKPAAKKKQNITNKKISNGNKKTSILKQVKKTFELPIKALLGWIVFKLNRGDYLLAIAKKRK